MYLNVIFFILFSKEIYCNTENGFENFLNKSLDSISFKKTEKSLNIQNERSYRFLTFNNDASNIRVEMVFAIPFLAIPIGGKQNPHTGVTKPSVDVNIKSLVAVGGILFMLFIIIPKIVYAYFSYPKPHSESGPHARESSINSILDFVDDALHSHNIDFQSCTQKAICWTLNNASKKVKLGKATGMEKILDALSSFYPLKYILEDTWLWNILENVPQFKDSEKGTCQKFNTKCSVNQNILNNAAGSLLKAIKAKKLN